MLQAKDHGIFFEGDSYLVLHTEKTGPSSYSYSIHFWLGKYTSQVSQILQTFLLVRTERSESFKNMLDSVINLFKIEWKVLFKNCESSRKGLPHGYFIC